MSTQPEAILEAILEANLVKQLSEELGYEKVLIADEETLKANLKRQLEKHNKTTLSDTEFARILNHLNKGNVFEKAKILRDKFALPKDNGTTEYIEQNSDEYRILRGLELRELKQNLGDDIHVVTKELKNAKKYKKGLLQQTFV